MEWERLLKLVRWLASAILFGLLFWVGELLFPFLTRPEPWYVTAAALLALLAAAIGWLAATWFVNKTLSDLGL